MLPLGPEEMLDVLRVLGKDDDQEIRDAVTSTMKGYDVVRLRPIIENPNTAGQILDFLSEWPSLPRDLYQPLIFHGQLPNEALARLASTTQVGEVIELISLKQQSLIQNPAIIDAILNNPRRTPEAERRAVEVRREFFEKEFGAQVVAQEQKAQAEAVAEELEVPPEPVVEEEIRLLDDLSMFIEADLIDTGDELFVHFEEEYGSVDSMPGLIEEPPAFDIESFFEGDEFVEEKQKEGFEERISILARIARMSVKDRIRFALKGTREVRMILIRDPNRPVCAAVIMNPRITEQEIESISALKSVNEEVLRIIGTNRAWSKNYTVIHNLVRNPKTPAAICLGFLNRIQTRDLRALGQNKNIPEVVRMMAFRTYQKRQSG